MVHTVFKVESQQLFYVAAAAVITHQRTQRVRTLSCCYFPMGILWL